MKIAVLGAGAFGTALGGILIEKGHEVGYFDPKLNNQLPDVLAGSKLMVLATPSCFAPALVSRLPLDIPLIVATKGLLTDKIFLRFNKFDVLSGPSFADDIKAKKDTFLTATSKELASLFQTNYLHFDYTVDKKGVLMCGALKNVYALLAGYDNLEVDSPIFTEYIKNVTSEMSDILRQNGADPSTVDLSCGKGDLEITCKLPSRNYEYGLRYRQSPNYLPEKTVEGLSTISLIRSGEIVIPENAKILQKILSIFSEKS